jgi:PIN domain nuclease of toxin-antitoxin system
VILTDTNALVWMATNSKHIGSKAAATIQRALVRGDAHYSPLSLFEAQTVFSRGRISWRGTPEDFRRILLGNGFLELDLTGDIALRASQMTGLPQDPIDRLISATADVHGATLITADEKILAWAGKLKRQDARL